MSSRRPVLYLIDGYALIYRAFFAMVSRPLTTSRGENTSAVWGIANFLFRLRDEFQPDYVAWVNDSGSSFRTETYPEYKATRQKLSDELRQDFDRSLERIVELLRAFGVRLLTVDGYEADDVIGTLARRATRAGLDVVIVSGDKDFYQLVDEHVSLLNPGRGGPAGVDETRVTTLNASEKFGVGPHQVIDYLALVGDASDNVPGVRGVGAKTAAQLLTEYGDLESILTHAGEIRSKRAREALLAEADNARLSRELVTIHLDVPLDAEPRELVPAEPDWPALQLLFTELEFNSLLRRVPESAGVPAVVEAQGGEFEIVAGTGELAALVAAVRGRAQLAVHVLLDSGDPLRGGLVGLGLAVPGRAWYLPLGHGGGTLALDGDINLPALDAPAMADLREVLQDPAIPKAGHDIKTAWLALRRHGVELAGVRFDTMLASFLVDPGRRSHELPVVVLEQLGREIAPLERITAGGTRPVSDATATEGRDYAAGAAQAVLSLAEHFAPMLQNMALTSLLADLEVPLVGVLVEMEWNGVLVDRQRLEELSRSFGEELQRMEQDIYREAGTEFNINSTAQLRHILFEKLNYPVIKKTRTGASTDADVLEQLGDMGFPLPRLLLEYREVSKLKSTYADTLPHAIDPRTGRIHTRFVQIGAATGRLASHDPNLQNIPVRTARGEEIRRCFIAAPDCVLVVADYSQVELRLLAHLSGDALLIDAFRRGGDIHRETASVIFEVPAGEVTPVMRERAKTINFATIYGQGPFALSRQLSISQQEAKDFITRYFERFSGVRRFLDEQVERAREKGYVETIFGRRRYIPELREKNFNIRAFGERTAMNSPIQGSAADLIKVAMVKLAAALGTELPGTRMLLQVHDELVLESPRAEAERAAEVLRREMEGAVLLSVPVVVDVGIGPNWLDAKKG